jgi:Ran GTPase-activating protein (RanGAP) involved in mRNA processing and transport
LRNNQISHTSAIELSNSISANTSLETLDLRWNNIGLVGGKAILSSLKKNNSLYKLELTGNNIPDDIVDSIGELNLNN